ncbi:MAG: DNA replication/repair protein RecF [Alphaproteobacteria bacterium]|jgi:DNA replication and repair protein RecF|nr:DNA replication/repair protein RecF [Alphaproteobacteria bacterium]MBT5158736.1 DNA replication/repair protein RecF [Alphaproteobacteria bacterium]MBT5917950.1 DNA replication/repair protein RecF [Alphaproteobacteria bacterium]MBT6386825.1 DNA replication/repair protein RecF [Alphaproteobacteria bacterium]
MPETSTTTSQPMTSAPNRAEAAAVTRLVLTNFRNYTSLKMNIAAAPVVLTGENGAGKTNLLEAVSFLSPGRGLRRAKLPDVTRRGRDQSRGLWAVAATLQDQTGKTDIGTGLEPVSAESDAEPSTRRVVHIDGVPARSANVLADISVVGWLTPQMDRLFIEGASARRRFLDRLVYGFDTGHARRVSAYEKALRERARLLRSGQRDLAWLSALENTMAEHGIAVAAARRDAVLRLGAAMDDGFGLAGENFPRAEVRADGVVEDWLAVHPAVEVESRFLDALKASRDQDAASGGAKTGPHRSDMAVVHGPKSMPANQCSTGEQKALLIAIILADARLQAARLGRAPILLLDEVAAHLDDTRRAALFEELIEIGGQAWLTGTDAALFKPLRNKAQFITVSQGEIAVAA